VKGPERPDDQEARATRGPELSRRAFSVSGLATVRRVGSLRYDLGPTGALIGVFEEGVNVMDKRDLLRLGRRDLLKLGGAMLIGGAAGWRRVSASEIEPRDCPKCLRESPCPTFNDDLFVEFYPTSPFILYPFREEIKPPEPLKPAKLEVLTEGELPAPDPGDGRQASDGLSTHQIWPDPDASEGDPRKLKLPKPILYKIDQRPGTHLFTNSDVQPIDAAGNPTARPNGDAHPGKLPASTIWGYAGARAGYPTFPGPLINAEYHKPVLVRFHNRFTDNDLVGMEDSSAFGSPCGEFLVHLHNAHTAPESDGNPNFKLCGYRPAQWVDNLYLNYPPAGDDREKQSFWWYHDHFHGHTGSNVYKGMVGLYLIYDPKLDPGDETRGLRLPGVRTNIWTEAGPTFKVDYDIPLALFDCRLDDGVTFHEDFHKCGESTDQKRWGKTFFKHFPDRGFVGDIFTVNGKAYPFMKVKRRKYRLRFLDASIARAYELVLMRSRSGPQAAPGTQGQWLLPDGERCMRFTQIASEGGLLPFPVPRKSITLWPAKRREVIVDFTHFPGDRETRDGDEIYLVNIMRMEDGRKPDSDDPRYKVPVLKFVIDGSEPAEDNSVIPASMRPLPAVDYNAPRFTFELERGGIRGNLEDLPLSEHEIEEAPHYEWTINGLPFVPDQPLVSPVKNQPEIWTIKSGGGWGHPMHFHQEEHQTLERNGVKIPRNGPITDEQLADDLGKEDTVKLDGSEEVVIYRNFRTFPASGFDKAQYVAHCHNLAHEDHSMQFGFNIVPKK
jgi:FtsP/CotA-like multicopper oxidase with cupredoxin domain